MATINIKSEIAGTVLSLEKQPGDPVDVDEVIALLDCMKMEIPVVSTAAGRISSVHIKAGETIAEGQLVAVVER